MGHKGPVLRPFVHSARKGLNPYLSITFYSNVRTDGDWTQGDLCNIRRVDGAGCTGWSVRIGHKSSKHYFWNGWVIMRSASAECMCSRISRCYCKIQIWKLVVVVVVVIAIIIISIIIIIIIISFMQFIYTYIPETNHVPREYSVSAILSLLFMVPISLVPALALAI